MPVARGLISAPALALAAVFGCGPPAGGPLEIGEHEPEDQFRLWDEGEVVPVVLGANGLNMIVPSLRATGINPKGPNPTVEVAVGGLLMAADIEGSRVDMRSDGVGRVLWDLRVPFQTELCCYVCQEGFVRARIKDKDGAVYEGEVTVRLQRGGCPDPAACCPSADNCPPGAVAQVCE